MKKPAVHQIEEQILRKTRNIGKLKDQNRYLQSRYFDFSDNSGNGAVKWRRLSFSADHYFYFTPPVPIRTFVKDYINDKLRNIATSLDDAINSTEILRNDSLIIESNVPRSENIIYFTQVRSINPLRLPITFISDLPFGLPAISCKIDVVFFDGEVAQTRTIYSSGSGPVGETTVYADIPANTDIVIMLYFYSGLDTSELDIAGNFRLNTNILELTNQNKIPMPYKPEGFRLESRIGGIALFWDLDPFASNSDQIRIQRGYLNVDTNLVENWSSIAMINGYSLNYVDQSVAPGETYYYRIQYVSVDGETSPFSDVLSAGSQPSPNFVNIQMLPNPLTGLVGYYNKSIKIKITCSEHSNMPLVTHTDSRGVVYNQPGLVTSDGGLTWNGTFSFSRNAIDGLPPFSEGKIILTVQVPINDVSGQEGMPLGANTAVGYITVLAFYIFDKTPPSFGGIGISKDNDATEDAFTGTANVFIFIKDSTDSNINTPTQIDPENPLITTKFISEIYQIQFSNNGADIASFSPWEDFRPLGSYSWALQGDQTLQTVYARIRDKAGNESLILSDSINLISEAPGSPANLILNAVGGPGSIVLTWNNLNDPSLGGYSIYRTTSPTDPRNTGYFYADVSDAAQTTYTDGNVTIGTLYEYALRVYNLLGVESTGWSNVAIARTQSLSNIQTLIQNGSFESIGAIKFPPGVFGVGGTNYQRIPYWQFTGGNNQIQVLDNDSIVAGNFVAPLHGRQYLHMLSGNDLEQVFNVTPSATGFGSTAITASFFNYRRSSGTMPQAVLTTYNKNPWKDATATINNCVTGTYTSGVSGWVYCALSATLNPSSYFAKLTFRESVNVVYGSFTDVVKVEYSNATNAITDTTYSTTYVDSARYNAVEIASGQIQSNNYKPTVTGFELDLDADTAEFNLRNGPKVNTNLSTSGVIKLTVDSGNTYWPYSPIKMITQAQLVSGSSQVVRFGGSGSAWVIASGLQSQLNLSDYFVDSFMLVPASTTGGGRAVRIEGVPNSEQSVSYWAPTMISSGLVVWHHPADLSFYSVGDAVTGWKDRSGNNLDGFSTSGVNSPIYTGGMVRFATVPCDLVYPTGISVVAPTGGYAFAMVMTPDRTDMVANFIFDNTTNGVNHDLALYWGDGSVGKTAIRDVSTLFRAEANQGVSGQKTIWVYAVDSILTTSYTRMNGTVVGSGQYTPSRIGPTAALGAGWNGVGTFGGNIGEFIIARYTSVADLARLEGYLASNWSLGALLPTSHSYYTGGPTSTGNAGTTASGIIVLDAVDYANGTRAIVASGAVSYQHWQTDTINRNILATFGSVKYSAIN